MKQSTFNKIARLVDEADCLNSEFANFFASYEIEDLEDADEIRDRLEEDNAFEIEILYYGRAMEYLSEHDASLHESLGIAEEYGYSVSDLSSELLATLLASQNAREVFDDLMSEIEDIIDENE